MIRSRTKGKLALPEMDFSNIRPIENSRNLGFEELVVQLFRRRYGREIEICRVGGKGGDSGVEAFWGRKRYGTIGLQAKYLKTLTGKKNQFDRSIKAALSNHPDLCQYVFVLPFDRRKVKQADDFRTWRAWVANWKNLAQEQYKKKRFSIKWCGASEIKGLLLDSEAKGLIEYYFGHPTFTVDEVRRQFEDTVEDLEDRYTDSINIETSAEERLEAFFGLSVFQQRYCDSVSALKKRAREFFRNFPGKPTKRSIISETAKARRCWRDIVGLLGDGRHLPPFTGITDRLQALRRVVSTIWDKCRDEHSACVRHRDPRWADSPWSERLSKAGDFAGVIDDMDNFVSSFNHWGKRHLLVTGDAGTGKSHLLAHIGFRLWKEGHPTVLLLGERFRRQDDPWKQVMATVQFEGFADSWLGLLNTLAEAGGKTAVILLDAVNESDSCKFWKTELIPFSRRITKYSSLRFVVTCRSDFTKYCLPGSLVDESDSQWGYVHHYGFDVDVVKAIEEYFNAYNVRSELFPPMFDEFSIPLFLKIFCKTYGGKLVKAHHLSLSQVLEDHKRYVSKSIAKKITCDEHDVHRAIEVLCDAMVVAGSNTIPMDNIRDKVNSLVASADASKSLFNHLRSSGPIRQIGPDDGEPSVAFAFERFYDFHVAQRILEKYPNTEAVIGNLKKKGELYKILADPNSRWTKRGLIGAFSVLFPEKFGVELIQLFRNIDHDIWSAFIESLRWRRADSITDTTEAILREGGGASIRFLMTNLVDLSAVPEKRFNADYIHEQLGSMKLAEREKEWTIPASNETFHNQECQLNRFVDWCLKVPAERLSEEQTRLSCTLLAWCFASTHVAFRDKVTRGAIRLLCGNPGVTARIVDRFARVDDPYIVERIYAAAAGVAMRCFDPEAVGIIAKKVFNLFFSGKEVPPHILTREYARCVMERALQMGVLTDGISPDDFRPPYRSVWPTVRTTDADIEELRKKKGAYSLVSSMRLEHEGMYGDFGRYEFQNTITNFSRFRFGEAYKKGRHYFDSAFDAKIAKRYVFDRVFEFGWTPEGLGELERSHFAGYGYSRARPTVERISKKYQWIAMHEMLGYLMDHYQRFRWSEEEPTRIEGPWQVGRRDFDPSEDVGIASGLAGYERASEFWWSPLADPIETPLAGREWIFADWAPEIRQILSLHDAQVGREWLTLCGYYDWTEYDAVRREDEDAPYRQAWLQVYSWLVPAKKALRLIREFREKHFFGYGIFPPEAYQCWVGEYPWGASCRELRGYFEGTPEWLSEMRERALTAGFIGRHGVLVPAPQVLSLLEASWTGTKANFARTRVGELEPVAINPTLWGMKGPAACLVGKKELISALTRKGFSVVWIVLGARDVLGTDVFYGRSEFTGVYWLEGGLIKGEITQRVRHEGHGDWSVGCAGPPASQE